MPNPTLYDNFSQVKQYIDQNQIDLSSYVTESELSNASYATTSYVANYVSQHGGSEVTYTYLSTYYPTKTAVNAMFSYDTLTGTLTITTLS